MISGKQSENNINHSARRQSASLAGRTIKGLAVTGALIALLWLDHMAEPEWIPRYESLPKGATELMGNGFIMIVFLLLITAAALLEFRAMANRVSAKASSFFMIATGFVILLAVWAGFAYQYGTFESCPASLRQPGLSAIMVLCLAAMGLFMRRCFTGPVEGTIAATAANVLGLIYIVIPFVFLTAIRVRWGTGVLFMVLTVCKFTDAGAYYAGTLAGGPRLAPVVSPNKTWAGLIGGILAALLAAIIINRWMPSLMGTFGALVFGLMTAVVAVMGDLAESLIKREAGIKDSGRIIRGQGGVLDMVDDVLFVAPCAYLYLVLVSSF